MGLEKFLTEEENQQIKNLLKRAKQRMHQQMQAQVHCGGGFQLLHCQIEVEQERFGTVGVPGFRGNPELMLKVICEHCNRQIECPHQMEQKDSEWEDKPFTSQKETDEADTYKKVMSGKVDALFSMYKRGMLPSLDYVAGELHMTIDDVNDWYQHWKEELDND